MKYCKRIKFDSSEEGAKPIILLGLIEHEDEWEIFLRTGRGKVHRIARRTIISIQDTDIVFEEGR